MAKDEAQSTRLPELLKQHQQTLVDEWIAELTATGARADVRIGPAELEGQCREFITLVQGALQSGERFSLTSDAYRPVREFLENISRSRVTQGFSSDETAMFIFSFKKPLFSRIRQQPGRNADQITADTWEATSLLDSLGLYTVRVFQKTREDVIERQQQELLELSTPVVKLWDGVLALPMIGTLDSSRTQIVMESLLQRIVDTGSEVAIIDITGVPTVDTLVAQHLLKTVTAIRLMGADAIISGVRPQIAQTIVHLGVDLAGVTTKASLADALALALKRSGYSVSKGNS